MFCYNCGCHLSEHDFCTSCGADVSLYKKIMCMSNRFYNDGLEKAGVRDLTGAINSLRQSLKFNKNNIEARNLLGLVYFETGEVVAALSEWVISKNMRPEKNIADDYINMLQSNAARLDAINQTIKKYSQALVYCNQDSKDLAIIQLKKVLSLNPKFIRAHQLLALLYMDSEQWDRAERELRKCMDIDRNNTLTLRYLKEVEMQLTPDENSKQTGRRKKDDAVRYQSDNEIIIQPLNVKEQKSAGLSSLINIAIGLIIGLAVMYFLVVPAAVSNANNEILNQFKTAFFCRFLFVAVLCQLVVGNVFSALAGFASFQDNILSCELFVAVNSCHFDGIAVFCYSGNTLASCFTDLFDIEFSIAADADDIGFLAIHTMLFD